MSIEAHKCNAPGCKGFVVFENADFDFKNMQVDEKAGCYAFDKPACSECRKEFVVVPHYIVIDIMDNVTGDYEELESACMTAVERRQKQIKYERETDPKKRIEMYIHKCGYSYNVSDILRGYKEHKDHGYVSYTMKDCITNLETDIRELLGLGNAE